jgi:hypothetical protein
MDLGKVVILPDRIAGLIVPGQWENSKRNLRASLASSSY